MTYPGGMDSDKNVEAIRANREVLDRLVQEQAERDHAAREHPDGPRTAVRT